MNRLNRRQFLGYGGILIGGALLPPLLNAPPAETWPLYLTFDGGFSTTEKMTGSTIDVLDVLKEYKVSATFFPNGRNLNTWEGPILSRILLDGHALGNRLWQETGNTAADRATATLLAAQYFKAEKKIRQLIQSTNQDAAQLYLKQARLYRRPGGDSQLASFLDPANYETLSREPYLKPYVDSIDWLKSVYDYSGWHVSAPKTAFSSYGLMRQITAGSAEARGVNAWLCVAGTKSRAAEVKNGLIVQLRDGDKLTPQALPQIILQLRAKGADFKTLPRTDDLPNTLISPTDALPTADPAQATCIQ